MSDRQSQRSHNIEGPYFAAVVKEKPYLDPIRWQHFLRCAARVRAVYSAPVGTPNEIKAYRAIIHYNNGNSIFPSLQQFLWEQTKLCGDLVSLLVPQSLNTLVLWYTFPRKEGLSRRREIVASLVSVKCPTLECLEIDHSHTTASLLLRSLLLFRQLRHLRTAWSRSLRFGPDHIRMLLTSLPLVELNARIEGFSTKQQAVAPIHASGLRNLRCVGTCADIAKVAASLLAPGLVSFRAGVTDEGTMSLSDIQGCIHTTLSNKYPRLRTFSIIPDFHSNTHEPHEAQAHAPIVDILRSCPMLPLLEVLILSFDPRTFALSLTDDDVWTLAQAIPHVHELSLYCLGPESRLPSPQALLHLATSCPSLVSLALSPPEGGPIPTSTVSHPLRELRIAGKALGTIEEPEKLAAFLDKLFPNLVEFYLPYGDVGNTDTNAPQEHRSKWQMAADILSSLQRERRQGDR